MREIDHIDTPKVILKIKDLCGHQKFLLTLIVRFTKTGNGLKLSNQAISDLLGVCERTAGRLLKDIASKKYAWIKNPHTKHRRLFLHENEKTTEIRQDKIWTENNILLRQVVTSRKNSTATNMVQNSSYRIQVVAHKDNTKDKVNSSVGKNANGDNINSPQDSTQPQDFDYFWKLYPRKVDKQEALKAWQKLSPDQKLFSEIMSALEKHILQPQWTKDNRQFIPYPATWLNRRRWTDVLDVTQEYITRDLTEAEADKLLEQVKSDS